MNPITIGDGIAPDVMFLDDRIVVAYGTTAGLELVWLALDGSLVKRRTYPEGFDQSFPRGSAPWLLYRQNAAHGYAAQAWNLTTGTIWAYTPAGATFGLTVNADLNIAAWEWQRPGEPWRIWFGDLMTGASGETPLPGAPDGLDTILSPTVVTLRKDTRGDVPGIWYPVQAGEMVVGELRDDPARPQGGIGIQLADDVLRVALPAQNAPDPRCATNGELYAVVCWNPVRVLLGTLADFRALPPASATEPPDPGPEPPDPPEPPEPTPQPPEPTPGPEPPAAFRHHRRL